MNRATPAALGEAGIAADIGEIGSGRGRLTPWHAVRTVLTTILISTVLVFPDRVVTRGSLASTVEFFLQPLRPGWTTIIVLRCCCLRFDALLGRRHNAILLVAPIALSLAFVGHQKVASTSATRSIRPISSTRARSSN